MPRCCITACCNATSGMGYSLHAFLNNKKLKRKWVSAVKCQRSNWDGPSSSSLLYSKHFTEDCFVMEGVQFSDALGILALKCLKPDAIPTIFVRSVDYLEASSTSTSNTPTSQPLSKRRE